MKHLKTGLGKVNKTKTRMHSSRMRTARGGVCPGGVSRNVGCPEGCVCVSIGMCLPGRGFCPGLCVCPEWCTPPHCMLGPPPDRMTDSSKNITFPQLRLRAVTMHGRYLDQNKSMWPDLAHVNKQKRLFDTRYL